MQWQRAVSGDIVESGDEKWCGLDDVSIGIF